MSAEVARIQTQLATIEDINEQQTSQVDDQQQEQEEFKQILPMRLVRIVKEGHQQTLRCAAFCFSKNDISAANLLATVAGDTAMVYDNAHMGRHLDPLLVFTNRRTELTRSGGSVNLTCVCWLRPSNASYDALVVLGGCDGLVHLLSVCRRRELSVLRGHTCDIVALDSHKDTLLSLDASGDVRLWNCIENTCLSVFSASASSIVRSFPLHPHPSIYSLIELH